MAKIDYQRDYYADLELSPTADEAEVRKAYRKLAFKWHPDRNRGKEDEVKEMFHIINTAQEVLTDATARAKFDAYRQRNSRYPTASGLKGNPWQYTAQEVNSRFGAPPKRPPFPTRPAASNTASAGSTQYWAWAQKQKTKTDNAKANMEAWDRSRPQARPTQPSAAAAASASRPGMRPAPTAQQAPPRTAAQARRQEAAFGTRRTGFAPTSPVGDEPPVRNQHYNTSSKDTGAAPDTSKPRPQSAFVDPLSAKFNETFLDNRQRTPYAANVGEKTNPFEPLNVNRAKSMRDGTRRFQSDVAEDANMPPPPPPRQRSASVGSDNFKRSTNEKPAFQEQNAKPTFQFQSRASARYSPRGTEPNSAPPTATFSGPESSTSSVNSSANATVNGGSTSANSGAKVYASPAFSPPYYDRGADFRAHFTTRYPHSNSRAGSGVTYETKFGFPAYMPAAASSGEQPSPGTNAFEGRLHAQLQHLLARTKPQSCKQPHESPAPNAWSPTRTWRWLKDPTPADIPRCSFSVPLDDDPTSPAHHARFTRNSADNINTRFVAEEKGGSNFRFSAGGPPSPEDSFVRAKQRARGHQSPLRNEFTSSAESFADATKQQQQQQESNKKSGDFVADEWKEAFGPHIFEPPQPGKPSTSPTRPIRPIKKTRPVRMTAGTAGIVDDDETSGEEKQRASPAPGSGIDGSRSPNAMDIDPPAAGPSPQVNNNNINLNPNVPRNINVEPTKPEWRAGSGNVNGVQPAEPKSGGSGGGVPINPNSAGSEDTEDFIRPMFSEFRNVEPFAAPKSTGLGSFADLSSNLPFPSRPSAKIPLAHEPKPVKQLEIPTPPTAPRPPACLVVPGTKVSAPAWTSYVSEFEEYMVKWLEFNKKVTDHFAARQKLNERKVDEKTRGLAWLNARGEEGVGEYMRSLEEDKFVRQKWMAACESHELWFREFLGARDRVVAAAAGRV